MVRSKDTRLPMLISQRIEGGGPGGHLAYGAWNEAEDVLADTSGVGIGVLDRHSHQPQIHTRRVLGRALRRVGGRSRLLPPTRGLAAAEGHDHVFFIARGAWDLPLLERLRSLRRRSLTLSIWIPEIWPTELSDKRLVYESYSMVDHVFVGIAAAAEPFVEIAPGAQIHVLPPAVDVLRFAPADPLTPRGIAVLGIGRRDPAQHGEILDWARSRRALYIYDTVKGEAIEWAEHRQALANLYQHANVAVCNYAKHDMPTVTGGLRVLPGRLFEGLAAGTVLIGLPPDEQRQKDVVGATVVEPLDGSRNQLRELLERFSDPLEAQPIRARNLALACRGQDWGHRWKEVFEVIGLPVPFGLQNRLDDLEKKAIVYDELADSL
ncbi:MAG: hypothetical protein WBM50_08950 [Acidimicrobiales bacterium]